MKYAMTVQEDDNGTFLVGFPDVPIANAVADTRMDARKQGFSALETAFGICREQKGTFPLPCLLSAPYEPHVEIPLLVALKILLWNELVMQGVSCNELAHRMNQESVQVYHLFNWSPILPGELQTLEFAVRVLGYNFNISLTR